MHVLRCCHAWSDCYNRAAKRPLCLACVCRRGRRPLSGPAHHVRPGQAGAGAREGRIKRALHCHHRCGSQPLSSVSATSTGVMQTPSIQMCTRSEEQRWRLPDRRLSACVQ